MPLLKNIGAGNGTRTRDLLITNQLLYQLSYTGFSNDCYVTIAKKNTTKSITILQGEIQ